MGKIRISCDDGCASDMKLAELCEKYNIELIIYLPVEWHSLAYLKGYEPLKFDQAVQLSKTHTLGSHTITHRHLTKIPTEQAEYEIEQSKYILEALFGNEIKYFAPPRGYSNDLLTEFTLRFYEKQRLTKEQGLVHIHPDSGANGNKSWLDRIDENTKELFCHSHELDRYNLWEELEAFLSESSK